MIGFAGLSHLGSVSSVAAAAKGFEVAAFDPDRGLTESLNCSEMPIFEPGLEARLDESRTRIRFTSDPAELASCLVLFISVDVPTDEDNQSDPSPIQGLIDAVLGELPTECILVILSQVPPGFTRGLACTIPGDYSSRLFYQVETLIFGQAVERALAPERVIVGCRDPKAALPEPYSTYLKAFDCPILPMRYESAELSKISINVCLVASIGATNMMAELCEGIGADWSEIVPALRLDRRIGRHAYLAPGLGIAGGNLERDLIAVKKLASEAGADAGLVDAWLTNSCHRRDWALRAIHGEVISGKSKPVVAIWGLTYKPDTASTKNSPALALIEGLRSFQVRAYDPKAELGGDRPNFVRTSSAMEACSGADVLVIMTPWAEFADIELKDVARAMAGRVIVDPFGVVDREASSHEGFRHFGLGWPVEADCG